MICHQQGRSDEADEWHHKARDWIANNTTDFEYVHILAEEADVLLGDD